MFLNGLSVFIFIPVTLGCGISTHTEIGYRAIEYFGYSDQESAKFIRNILLNHQDSFQAGNPYPDSFYNSLCYDGMYHDRSEDTHWGHYVKVAFDFVNRKYPQPWSQDAEKLVAFLFGIIAHQVSDISWHSMEGLQNGYLDILAKYAFHDSFGTAHTYGDVADDMIGVFEWNVTSYAYEWYVPVQDLVEIYDDYYGSEENVMTEEIVNTCSGMLLIGRLGEHIIGRSLYYYYVKQAPIMLDLFRDYQLGGLDDMSTWTNIVWRQAAKALLNGTDNCEIPHNTLGLNCDNVGDDMDLVVNMMGKNLYHNPGEKPFSNELPNVEDLEFIPEGRGMRIRIPQGIVEEVLSMEANHGEYNDYMKEDPSDVEPHFTLSTRNAYNSLGKDLKIIDFNKDGKLDIVVSAPGVSGCVYVIMDILSVLEEDSLNIIEDVATIKLCTDIEYARFGTAVAVTDINNDGVNDLVIGHPYTGADSLQYEGGVTIYTGDVSGQQFQLNPSIKFTCTEHPCGLGRTIFAHNGTIFLGAPEAGAGGRQRGAVVRISNSTGDLLKRNYSMPGDISWSFTGNQDFEHFGSSITVSDQFDTIVIGSPTYRVPAIDDSSYTEDDLQVAGKVTFIQNGIYRITEMIGTSEFDSLGASLQTVTLSIDGQSMPFLAIGKISSNSTDGKYEQTGSILLVDGIFHSNVSIISSISGNMEIGRFGMKLASGWDQDGNGLIVTAPYAGLGLENYGKLYYFKGDVNYPKGDITSACESEPVPCTDEWTSLMISPHDHESLFGSQVSWDKTEQGEVILAVAAERSSLGSRLGGAVYFYIFS